MNPNIETKLERVRSDLAAGKSLAADDCWFLVEEISRYRDLLRHARYQTVQVTVTAQEPKDGEAVTITAHVVASEEATERALIRECRRVFLRLIRSAKE